MHLAFLALSSPTSCLCNEIFFLAAMMTDRGRLLFWQVQKCVRPSVRLSLRRPRPPKGIRENLRSHCTTPHILVRGHEIWHPQDKKAERGASRTIWNWRIQQRALRQEIKINLAAADSMAWPGSDWLLLSFSPFPVWHPIYEPEQTERGRESKNLTNLQVSYMVGH